MVSSTLVKLSSPVARSCLVALSGALLIDAILTLYAAVQYPYLIDNYNITYVTSSRTIAVVYSGVAVTAILVSISTAFACYKSATNYVLIHVGITGIFLPISILVYFTTISSRYKINDYSYEIRESIDDYRIDTRHHRKEHLPNGNGDGRNGGQQQTTRRDSMDDTSSKFLLSSYIFLIDSIQTKFSCCGADSPQDWIKRWHGFIPPTCCKEPAVATNEQWANVFQTESDYQFKHCPESNSYQLGCLVAMKEDEYGKYSWLSDLIVFMIVVTIANTIVSLLLFGLSKTENSSYGGHEHELSMVGATATPGPYLPTITSIKHRPSVVTTLGPSAESISARAQAVRFNISNSPRTSISGPSKFSAGARRGSSFI